MKYFGGYLGVALYYGTVVEKNRAIFIAFELVDTNSKITMNVGVNKLYFFKSKVKFNR